MAPPAKFYHLAQTLFDTVRTSFGIYSSWYHQRNLYYEELERQQRRLQQRKRGHEEIFSSAPGYAAAAGIRHGAAEQQQQQLSPIQRSRTVRRRMEATTTFATEGQTPATTSNMQEGLPLLEGEEQREVSLDLSDQQRLLQRRARLGLDHISTSNREREAATTATARGDEEETQKEHAPKQRYPVGTRVRKHFPGDGWFDGSVVEVKWVGQKDQWAYFLCFDGRNKIDVVDEAQLSDLATDRFQDPTLFSFEEFLDLWERLNPEKIEKSSTVRRANSRIETGDSETQHNAQYGRILPHATELLFQVLRLKRSDVFLDVGHGIGNFCLQAAYCAGCESRGIEVVRDRYNVSLQFAASIENMAKELDAEEDRSRIPGKVMLRHGDLSDHYKHNWLVRANKVVVNNFNGVFAERSYCKSDAGQATDWHLDHYIAGLFASMPEGSIMVTLSDLQLGPTQKEVNKWRQDNNLKQSPNASFFDVIKIELGEAWQVFSWSSSNKAPAYAYVYRRVKQNRELRTASTLCCNINCEHSKLGTPIPAVALNREGKAVVGTCECRMTLRSNRRIPLVKVSDFLNSEEYCEWGR